ncbi:branched-chain amino acid transport system ATP-binding protein [Kitasatospora sp. MAP12-15]|uniref:ATP-binding cassette domain-containing protein n=1 Tax=unclassified Kitasatospora TaxID=2633591 RepID=UPI0024765165|nr:ATP-binding cassette domain-containing protein [Kitasatospora sp. MAP12-44]MDH6115305.1 branched-chain amino acid transport system ATP-binding protein [Kitasatospora sp. MAP12-44]
MSGSGTEAENGAGVLAGRGVLRRLGGVAVVDGVDLVVRPGRVTALVGPNGAGKSVLLDCLSGLARPDGGRILLDGRDITRSPCHRRARLGVARTFQQVAVFPELTVAENVQVGAEQQRQRAGHPLAVRDRVAGALRLLGLTSLAHRPAGDLPLGVLRLVELARALAGSPRVLLVDEVSVGLDAGQVAWVARVLALVAREGAGVLLVEHDLGLVSRLAELAYVLDGGRVVATGPIERVLADQRVRRLW